MVVVCAQGVSRTGHPVVRIIMAIDQGNVYGFEPYNCCSPTRQGSDASAEIPMKYKDDTGQHRWYLPIPWCLPVKHQEGTKVIVQYSPA
jgi:hypothetical protein